MAISDQERAAFVTNDEPTWVKNAQVSALPAGSRLWSSPLAASHRVGSPQNSLSGMD
jgi:hypothetical protein